MKVSFFLHNLEIGGVSKVLIGIANYISNIGIDVEFVLCQKRGDLLETLDSSITINDLGNVKMKNALFPLVKYIRQERPDYMFTGTDLANFIVILACLLARTSTKSIVSQHNMRSVEHVNYGVFRFFFPLMMKILYPLAYKVVAVSDGVSEFLLKLGISNKNVVVIYNPIDVALLKELSAKDCSLLKEDVSPFIIFVGRLVKVKNLPLLLKAFAILSKSEKIDLLIVGDGPEYETLLSLVKDLDIDQRVHFLGNMSNPYPYLKKSNLCVLPSLSEALPTVLIEAMALGTTCVATMSDGAKEVLNDGEFGYLCNSFENEKEFSSQILFGLNNTISSQKLEEGIEKYKPQNVFPRYLNLFK